MRHSIYSLCPKRSVSLELVYEVMYRSYLHRIIEVQNEATETVQPANNVHDGEERGESRSTHPKRPSSKYRRGAVSAEAYTEEDVTNYVKKVRSRFLLALINNVKHLATNATSNNESNVWIKYTYIRTTYMCMRVCSGEVRTRLRT
jgi:hypothetical protein